MVLTWIHCGRADGGIGCVIHAPGVRTMTRVLVHLASPGWPSSRAYCELGYALMYIHQYVRGIELADDDGYVLVCDPMVGPLVEDLKRRSRYLEVWVEFDPEPSIYDNARSLHGHV